MRAWEVFGMAGDHLKYPDRGAGVLDGESGGIDAGRHRTAEELPGHQAHEGADPGSESGE
jgi:hypothetical protein